MGSETEHWQAPESGTSTPGPGPGPARQCQHCQGAAHPNPSYAPGLSESCRMGRRWAAAGRPGRAGLRRPGLRRGRTAAPAAGRRRSRPRRQDTAAPCCAPRRRLPRRRDPGLATRRVGRPAACHKLPPPPPSAAARHCRGRSGGALLSGSRLRSPRRQNTKGSALSSLTGGHSAIFLCFSHHHSVDKIVLLVPDRPDSESGQSSDSSLLAVTRAQKAIAISKPPVRFPNSTHQSVLLAYSVGRHRRRGWKRTSPQRLERSKALDL
jgi:hypothetical protein